MTIALHDALRAAHLLAIVLWVGGMAFTLLFLRPALATLEPPQRLRLMLAVLRRFLAAVGAAIAVIVVSGTWMIVDAAAAAPGAFRWPADWVAMVALGVVMFGLYGHVRGPLLRRLGAAVDAQDGAAGAAALASIRRWVQVNLAIGVGLIAVVVAV